MKDKFEDLYWNRVKNIFSESINVKSMFYNKNYDKIFQAAEVIFSCIFFNHGKVLIFGNGGSAADSQHIAGEFINRFLIDRKSYPAIALTTDTSVITAIGNDYSYDEIFSRQVDALATSVDICIGISTSGNSINVLNGLKAAKEKGSKIITFLGCDGGIIAKEIDADIHFIVPSNSTPRIQETHILLAHTLCEIVEDALTKKD